MVEPVFVIHQAHGVIGDVFGLMLAAEFAKTHCLFVGLGRRKVFVFGDAGMGHFFVAVVHHRRSLEVTVGDELFEVEGSVPKSAEVIAKVGIERPAPDHMVVLVS